MRKAGDQSPDAVALRGVIRRFNQKGIGPITERINFEKASNVDGGAVMS